MPVIFFALYSSPNFSKLTDIIFGGFLNIGTALGASVIDFSSLPFISNSI